MENNEVEVQADDRLEQLVDGIPMLRWGKIRRRYDVSMQDLPKAEEVLMVVAANELHRHQNGVPPMSMKGDDYERFERMGMSEITEFLGLDDDDEDDSKSDDAEVDGD